MADDSTRIDVRHDYSAFLRSKTTPGVRYDGDFAIMPQWRDASAEVARRVSDMAPHLHEYQRFSATFAVARKRAAIFAECGLGKTSIALSWAMSVADGGPVIIAAPLAAQHEFINERDKFFPGVDLRIVATGDFPAWLAAKQGIALVTHHAFIDDRDLSGVAAFVLDESSILKSGEGAIATNLCRAVQPVPYRLALSATPAPNDPTEFATHATWLGYMRSDAEFRARFFVHDGKDWRLKGHAREEMPRWFSRFALWMSDPSVYGMPCAEALPEPYRVTHFRCDTPDGVKALIPRNLLGEASTVMTMSQRSKIRQGLYADDNRMDRIVELARGHACIVWAKFNAHADALQDALATAGIKVRQIAGTTSDEDRVAIVRAFQAGDLDCIVSKASVIGHGVNLQRCDRMIFAAYDESYEAFHQAVRRAHRQGRVGQLEIFLPVTPDEDRIIRALETKGQRWRDDSARQEQEFARNLAADLMAYREGKAMSEKIDTAERLPAVQTDYYRLIHGDCIEEMDRLDADSMDLAVFSPPFSNLYTYSSETADMGNCQDGTVEFNLHFAHFSDALLRVMKPGRVVCLHLAQLVSFRARQGRKGLRDFRGTVIDAMEDSGFLFYGEFVIPKNPQATAIRTKSERLQFSQFRRDSLESSPALNDFVLEFRKPGKQAVSVSPQVSNEEWIEWASGVWHGINESDVLSGWRRARGDDDEKHICPLQLEVIERCIRLWSNEGEVVFTPFLGIGSEAYQAIKLKRKAVGVELKAEYFAQAVCNCDMAVSETHDQLSLFGGDE